MSEPARRIVIAGCGDLGGRLAARLLAQGAAVWGVRRQVGKLAAGVAPIAGDLTHAGAFPALPDAIDTLVYCAAPARRDPTAYRSTYVDGLANALAQLQRQAQKPRRILLTSSTAVYHQDDGQWVDETSPTEPTGFAGRTLLAAEDLLRQSGLPHIIARLGGIYGPGRTRLLTTVRAGTLRLRDEPPEYTNRIHSDDAAAALAHLLTLPDPLDCYLLVDCDPAPKAEVADWLAARLGLPRPQRLPLSASPSGQNKRCSNARLLASGFEPGYRTYRDGYGELLENAG